MADEGFGDLFKRVPLPHVRKIVRELLTKGATVEFIQHALDEMDHDDLTIPEVLFVMRSGAVLACEMHGMKWRITSEGKNPRGARTRVIYEVRRVDRFLVITVMDLEKGWARR